MARWRRGAHGLLALLVVCLAGGPARANSVRVTSSTPGSGTFALEIQLDDPATTPAGEAWIGIGPEAGLRHETALLGRFWVNPDALELPEGPGRTRLAFFRLLPSIAPDAAGVRFFVERVEGSWYLGAEAWERLTARYRPIGRGALAEPGAASAASLIEFDWSTASQPQGSDGHLRVYRVTPEGEKLSLFAAEDLENGFEWVSLLQLGVAEPALQPYGSSGTLVVDDVSIYRGPAPRPLAAVAEIVQERQCFGRSQTSTRLTLRADGTAQRLELAQPRLQLAESAYESILAEGEMERISSLLLSLGFFSLESEYRPGNVADGCWVITEVERYGERKRVVNANGAGPAALRLIESEFQALAARMAWRPRP